MEFFIFGVDIYPYFSAIIIFLLALFVLKIFKVVIISRLEKFSKKTETEVDDVIIGAINKIGLPFYGAFALYIMSQFSNLPGKAEKWIGIFFFLALIYYAIKFVSGLIDYGSKKVMEKKSDDENKGIVKLISVAMKVFLWLGAIVLILSNMGYNVTSLIAGLGIGGIAIGLALQSILGDLFSSLVIYFDKPFNIGDYIVVGDKNGTVKHVGIKTTRITSLQGEEIVFSNTDITNSRVQNFGKMQERRTAFSVGVAYDTPVEKLKRIPEIISNIIAGVENCRLDRSHFASFGDSALNYDTVYYVASGDFAAYMDAQQSINLQIMEAFEKEKITIAFPTRTVYLKKE